MGVYDTYLRGPILVGSGIDSIGALDEGSVVTVQQKNVNPFASGADVYFQVPINIRLKEIYIDLGGTAGVNPTAGTYTVALGTAATQAGTPLILANAVALNTNGPRTLAGYANPDPNAWALTTNSGPNTFLRVSLASVTPAGVTRLSVLISYVILPTTP